MVNKFKWNIIKNAVLKSKYGISYEEIINCEVIKTIEHPKRKNQYIMLVMYKNYIWAIPFVIDKDRRFLKTFYPSRKFNALYGGRYDQEI